MFENVVDLRINKKKPYLSHRRAIEPNKHYSFNKRQERKGPIFYAKVDREPIL